MPTSKHDDMKILMISPKIPQNFWTFQELCRFRASKTLVPPLGLLTVAALLPREWEVRLVDTNARPLTEEDWDWATLVMLSGMIVQKAGMLALIREAKQRDKTVVVGGLYATSSPQEVLAAGADFLVQGEAETSIGLLLAAIQEGKKDGIFRSDEKPDMTLSPVPRFDLLNLKDYMCMGVQTSRGCPFDCEFCDVVTIFGRGSRCKTPDQVIEELETLYNLGWRREVFITDDNFVGSKSHAKAVLPKLIDWQERRGKPFDFWCQASVTLGRDLELIDLMTEANFYQVFLGVETPDEDILGRAGKYQNRLDPLSQSLHNLNKNGLGITASFVIGFDGEKKGIGERICEFLEESSVPMAQICILQALPNTRLWNRLKNEGRLLAHTPDGLYLGGRLNFIPSRPESEVMEEYFNAWEYMYEPSRYLARAYRFYLTMRPTRRALAIQKGESQIPSMGKRTKSLREKLLDVGGFLYLAWMLGVVSRCRVQFWRQLLGMKRKNPSRLPKYLVSLFIGQSLFRFTRAMLKEVRLRGAWTNEVGIPRGNTGNVLKSGIGS